LDFNPVNDYSYKCIIGAYQKVTFRKHLRFFIKEDLLIISLINRDGSTNYEVT